MKSKNIWWLFLFLALAFPILFGSLTIPGLTHGGAVIYKLSRLSGLVAFILFGIQFGLGAKLKFIERNFGHDKMVGLHRIFGLVALGLVLFHAGSAMQSALGRNQLGLLWGIIAFFLLIIMLLFILVQKLFQPKYELWAIVHELNYVIFPLAYIHSLVLGTSLRSSLVWQVLWGFLGLAFVGIIIYKIHNEYWIRKNRFEVTHVISETANVWSLQFKPKQFHFLPGQFMILRLIQNGIVSEPHPFTIASSPSTDTLAVSIKAVGDFTATVSQTKTGDYAWIDAPFGKFSFLEFPAEAYVFIAGGIGITPFMSMLRYMQDQKITKKVLLLWGNQTEQDIAFRSELNQLEQVLKELKVVHVISNGSPSGCESGFINAALIQKYVKDLQTPEIFLCGPPRMMKFVRKELASLKVQKRRIHFERFSW